MRKLVSLTVLLALLMACKPTVPSRYVQPDDMADILYDYHVAQAMTSYQGDESVGRHVNFAAVLRKYDVSEADFDSSLVYYYSHADRLKTIYERVNERLDAEAAALGVAIGPMNQFSQYSASGDTANVWTLQTDVLLAAGPAMNRFDFTVKGDSTYRRGDSFMFQFVSDYIWQGGTKDVVLCMVARYEGDSIVQTYSHYSSAGACQLRLPANDKAALKELKGYIYLHAGDDDARMRRLMFVSQMQLIRFHNKLIDNEPEQKDTVKTDSVQRADVADRTVAQPAGSRIVGRRDSGKILPPAERIAIHRMETRPPVGKK